LAFFLIADGDLLSHPQTAHIDVAYKWSPILGPDDPPGGKREPNHVRQSLVDAGLHLPFDFRIDRLCYDGADRFKTWRRMSISAPTRREQADE
jgi:hypothetical protein